MTPYTVICWVKSPSTRSHVGLVSPAASREDGLAIGRKWVMQHAEPAGVFRYVGDYEVGYRVERRP